MYLHHKKGFRLFELDIIKTSAGHSVKTGLKKGIISAMPSENVVFAIEGDKIKVLKELGIKNIEIGKDEAFVTCNDLDYVFGQYADKWKFNNY